MMTDFRFLDELMIERFFIKDIIVVSGCKLIDVSFEIRESNAGHFWYS